MLAAAFAFKSGGSGVSAAGAARYTSGVSPFQLAAADGHARIKLQDPYKLDASAAAPEGAARARGLARGDFDGDGYPDLVSAFATDGGGYLAVQRGDAEAFAPTLPENVENTNKSRFGAAFLPGGDIVALPVAPDFVVAGDFDRDRVQDIVAARRGDANLYFIKGDGRGGFAGAEALALPGAATALAAGEFDQPNDAPDAVVSVFGSNGAQLLVFSDADGVRGKAQSFAIDQPAETIGVARVDGDSFGDALVFGGGTVSVVHGRPAGGAADERLERIPLGFEARAAVAGDFVWDRAGLSEVAALGADGVVRVMTQGVLDSRPLTVAESRAIRAEQIAAAAKSGSKANGRVGRRAPASWNISKSAVWRDDRELPVLDAAGVAAATASRAVLAAANLSGQAAADLIVSDPSAGVLRIFAVEAPEPVDGIAETFDGPRRELALPVDGAAVDVIAMRTSLFVREGLVVLKDDAAAAEIFPSAPSATFTVTKGTDTNDGLCNADCSLREAQVAANSAAGADLITISAGSYTLSLSGNDDVSAVGDLDVTGDITYSGANSATTIVQGGSTASNGVDRVVNVNSVCTSPVSGTFNNLTVRFGRNTRPFNAGDFSETSGGIDFCGASTGGMTLTNSVIDQNSSVNSYGGGINLDSTVPSSGTVQLTGVTISGNTAGNGTGAGINVIGNAVNLTVTGSTISSNNATATTAFGVPKGGGVHVLLTNSGSVSISSSTISNNTADSYGGGIAHMLSAPSVSTLSVSLTTISGNTSRGQGTGAVSMGGGMYVETAAGQSATLTKLTVTGNTATTSPSGGTSRGGGGLGFGSGNSTLSFSRIAGNTASSGTGVLKDVNSGTVTASNNWWGCHTGPSASPCDTAVAQGGTLTSTPYLRGTNTASSTSIVTGQTSTLTLSFLTNSAGSAISASNLDVLIGRTVSWGSATLGSLSSQVVTVQAAGTATATFTATAVGTTGGATATVDSGGVATSPAITVAKASTTASIISDTPDPSNVGQSVTVSYSVAVTAPGGGTPTGNVVVSDGVSSCTGTVAAGSCSVALSTAGARTLTATYQGDTNYNVSPASSGASHTVGTVTWTGATSSAFSTGSNWNTGQAPGAGDTAVIPAGATNQPAISGATTLSSLTVAAGRTLTVGSTLTVTGTLTNNGTINGTGTIVNNFSNAGTVAPGNSPGILSVTGTYANTGSLNIEIGGTGGAGVNPNGHDQLLVSGAATLGGTLNVTLTNSYVPVNGATFVILDAASSTGTFATLNLPTLARGQFDVTYNNAAGTVTLTANIPTAAGVIIAGRVATNQGTAISNAIVTITDSQGAIVGTARTNTFGRYLVDDLTAGAIYTVNVGAKSYRFTPRLVNLVDRLDDIDFIAEP